MGQRLSPEQQTLYQLIDDILWTEWDPVGINSVEAARDEYYSYLFPLMNLLIQGADENRISSFLYQCETIDLGMEGSKPHCDEVAKRISGVRDKIFSYKNNSIN